MRVGLEVEAEAFVDPRLTPAVDVPRAAWGDLDTPTMPQPVGGRRERALDD
jgi:hypothetical protein